jgi:hypothetical protein
MAFELRNGSGSLFRNNEKKNASAPDYTGTLKDHAGKSWRLAGWLKDSSKGKFLSISMSEQTAPQAVSKEDSGLPF